jgi:NAD(P)-dependent dehydrogenase (short-subunit alcohol dehydrogenase family)
LCTALVTGANRGIGRAVTARLHSLGHRVVVTARAERAAVDVAAELGHPAIGIALDVTDAESVERARTRAGHVDMQSLVRGCTYARPAGWFSSRTEGSARDW